MDAGVLLCDSTICRLCAEENDNGTILFGNEEPKENLSDLINKYLPLKVQEDGKFPNTLCPGCTIQLEATKSFFDLIIEGQDRLRALYNAQRETVRRQEKQKEEFENVFKAVNPNSSMQTYSVHTDSSGEEIYIQIVTDGPLFPPSHEMSLRFEALDKPKRKRGRPPKPPQLVETVPIVEEVREQEEESDCEVDGKRKRRIKKPVRYSELIQGKELDRIFREEGVIDDDELLSDNEPKLVIPGDPAGQEDVPETKEVIGHMQGKDGENLGPLVMIKGGSRVRLKHKNETNPSPINTAHLNQPTNPVSDTTELHDVLDSPGAKKKDKYECEFCGRVFLHLGRLEIHKSFHKDIKYQCTAAECVENFDTKTALDGHQSEAGHSGSTLIECLENYGQVELLPQANTEFIPASPDQPMEENQPSVSGAGKVEPKITCEICCKSFSCKQNFEIHMKAVHENQKPYSCDKCDKKFPYLNSLKSHMLAHNEKTYPCESCDKVFHHPSSIVYHREAEHNNGRKFVCNKCKKTFKHKQLLLRHQLVHTNERPHSCLICGASFKTRANLLTHMPTHTGEKKYYCTQCGQSFTHKTSLTLHIRWHNGQKPYECDVCMKTFSQRGNLAEHRRIHTGEKPYCCNYCGRRFTTSSQFKLHMKRHTGERPWKCEYCLKTFLHKDTWKCHTRRHRNERPFQCQQCLRGFTEQWALKKHERLHTGEKPYVCDICTKAFADSSNLTKHKKVHWNKNKGKGKNSTQNIINVAASDDQASNQILYLTYQDNISNEEQPQTLVHIVDAMGENTDEKMNNVLFTDENMLKQNNEVALEDIQLQQLIDNEGNAISLTTADGQLIKVVSTIVDDEHSIQGLLPDGTLIPINLTMQDGKPVALESEPKSEVVDMKENILLLSQDAQSIDENKIQYLNPTDKISDPNLQNKLQFLTDDGQNVCYISSFDCDTNIQNHYINMQ